ncbi:hypothetical protein LCGC14_0924480 [marine sediment metagenome]|uniref:Uncharacterized protein n=1 Tax=marine sediment metagenome TaxID=412755 RepID=A0A0F9R8J3_9ZZZZ
MKRFIEIFDDADGLEKTIDTNRIVSFERWDIGPNKYVLRLDTDHVVQVREMGGCTTLEYVTWLPVFENRPEREWLYAYLRRS